MSDGDNSEDNETPAEACPPAMSSVEAGNVLAEARQRAISSVEAGNVTLSGTGQLRPLIRLMSNLEGLFAEAPRGSITRIVVRSGLVRVNPDNPRTDPNLVTKCSNLAAEYRKGRRGKPPRKVKNYWFLARALAEELDLNKDEVFERLFRGIDLSVGGDQKAGADDLAPAQWVHEWLRAELDAIAARHALDSYFQDSLGTKLAAMPLPKCGNEVASLHDVPVRFDDDMEDWPSVLLGGILKASSNKTKLTITREDGTRQTQEGYVYWVERVYLALGHNARWVTQPYLKFEAGMAVYFNYRMRFRWFEYPNVEGPETARFPDTVGGRRPACVTVAYDISEEQALFKGMPLAGRPGDLMLGEAPAVRLEPLNAKTMDQCLKRGSMLKLDGQFLPEWSSYPAALLSPPDSLLGMIEAALLDAADASGSRYIQELDRQAGILRATFDSDRQKARQWAESARSARLEELRQEISASLSKAMSDGDLER